MSDSFQTFEYPLKSEPKFSILIPTWNNLPLLKNCVNSIKRNSHYNCEILVFVNEGNDGTSEWLKSNGITHMVSESNEGICVAMNSICKLVRSKIVCYLNDDMYVCPNWDKVVLDKIESEELSDYFISSTMIEPHFTNNPCTILANYGDTLDEFDEEKLLDSYDEHNKDDWSGSTWPPLFLSSDLWNKIGGFSEEFSPGMYSDPDMAIKAWKVGNRSYIGLSKSRVYHFGSKSTKRVKKNKGRKTFILKWGISSRFFYKNYLKMGEIHQGKLPEFKPNILDTFINGLKVLKERYF